MTKTSKNRHHVVIIGAGFGGIEVANQLAGVEVDVTIIDRRNHHLFQPLLYQVAVEGSKTKPSDAATIPQGSVRAAVGNRRKIAANSANSAAEGPSAANQATGTPLIDALGAGKPILDPLLASRYGAGKGCLNFLYILSHC